MTPHAIRPFSPRQLFPRYDWRAGVILGLVVVAGMVMANAAPMAQSQAFHRFADTRAWLGVPNFMDVVTNGPFAVAAVMGLVNLRRRVRAERGQVVGAAARLRVDCVCLSAVFVGIGLTSVGSAYYHLAPGNERLFWDRLPMVLTFVSLLATLVAERVSPKTAAWLLGPVLVAATASLVYWRQTEELGRGDLRAYFFIEAAALVSVVLIVVLYPSRYLPTKWLTVGLGCYGAAVVFEQLDRVVWGMWRVVGIQEVVSGHTVKHACAGVGAGVLGWAVRKSAGARK